MKDCNLEEKKYISAEFQKRKEVFSLIGDQTRLSIICKILESPEGELTVDEITNQIYLSRPAISHHLKTLKDAGILKSREISRYNYYSLNEDSPIWEDLVSFFDKLGICLMKRNK